MPAEHIKYDDVLRDGTDKLNIAIDQANKAESDSSEAKDVSANAKVISDEAKNIAEEANSKSSNAETTANSALSKSQTAISTADDAKGISEQANLRVDNIIFQNGSDNTEVVDGRLGTDGTVHTTLGGHVRSLGAQLAQTTSEMKNTTRPSVAQAKKTILTFIDDDIKTEAYTAWLTLAREKGVKISFGVVPSLVDTDGFVTTSQLQEIYDDGHEFLSHGWRSVSLKYRIGNPEGMKAELYDSQKWLIDNGYTRNNGYKYWVHPQGLNGTEEENLQVKAEVKKYYEYGINAYTTEAHLKKGVFDSFDMPRVTGDGKTPEFLIGKLDDTIADGGWMIVLTHASRMLDQDGGDYATWKERYSQLIDHANINGVEIMTFGEAIKERGNSLSIGEWKNSNHLYVNYDGSYSGSNSFLSKNMDAPITDYQKNKETIVHLTTTFDNFLSVGGIMKVFHGEQNFSFATYSPYNSNDVYRRIWNDSTDSWESWKKIAQVISEPPTLPTTMDAPITDYPQYKTSDIELFSSKDTFLGVGGLMSVRHGSSNLSFAIYYPYNSNSVYKRRWIENSSSWGAWEKISAI